ncbi:hypothetical protein IV88_GL001560 [Pediococcus argentinicus]|uniref:Uncharacterized protein n=2 Tax=Pediococcus argentinicus TaxID=480391 RepID=A0A0R2NJ55_9LACO|nr:hypothetical protein IV88_GL001560 [Pediococcus argentinicus]
MSFYNLNFFRNLMAAITCCMFIINIWTFPATISGFALTTSLFVPSILISLAAKDGTLSREDSKKLGKDIQIITIIFVIILLVGLGLPSRGMNYLSGWLSIIIKLVITVFALWITFLLFYFVAREDTASSKRVENFAEKKDNEALEKMKADRVAGNIANKDDKKKQFGKLASEALSKKRNRSNKPKGRM